MAKPLPSRRHLSLGEAVEIKQELWDGVSTQSSIAEAYSVSQTTISRIMHGSQWADAPWPSGATGAIPNDRRDAIYRERNLIVGSRHPLPARVDQTVEAASRVAEREAVEAQARDKKFADSIKMKKE